MKQFIYIHDRMPKAYLVTVGGRTLPAFQSLVEGLIDVVSVSGQQMSTIVGDIGGMQADLIVNDEGLYDERFTINVWASALAGREIVGPVVLSLSDSDGETVGFTSAQIAHAVEAFGPMLDTHGGRGWDTAMIAGTVHLFEEKHTVPTA